MKKISFWDPQPHKLPPMHSVWGLRWKRRNDKGRVCLFLPKAKMSVVNEC